MVSPWAMARSVRSHLELRRRMDDINGRRHDARRPRNQPRAILFDWDNTLVDNWAVIAKR